MPKWTCHFPSFHQWTCFFSHEIAIFLSELAIFPGFPPWTPRLSHGKTAKRQDRRSSWRTLRVRGAAMVHGPGSAATELLDAAEGLQGPWKGLRVPWSQGIEKRVVVLPQWAIHRVLSWGPQKSNNSRVGFCWWYIELVFICFYGIITHS